MPLDLWVGNAGMGLADERTLAKVTFSERHEIGADGRSLVIGQPVFAGGSTVECWRSDRPVETGRHGDIAYATDGRFLFGHLLLDEKPGGCLEEPAHYAYEALLTLLKGFGGLHCLRIWNIIDAINEDRAGLERYRSFCVGRARALAKAGMSDELLPAASGVGATAPGLLLTFIAAADEPGRQIENPRQVSAFHYPTEHGPKSPSFSRALLYPLSAGKDLLFISGTASIVGHETRHVGDLDQQFDETCRNLEAVKARAGSNLTYQALRVYVRHDHDAPAVQKRCRETFGEAMPMIPLRSAICRKDLLLEIEAVASTTDENK